MIPDTPQKIRARFTPSVSGSGRPPFTRIEGDNISEEYLLEYQKRHGRSIDKADGEYRSDIDYAVRDGIRFDKGSDLPPVNSSDRETRWFGNNEAPNDGSCRSGGDPLDKSGPAEPQGRAKVQDRPSSALSQPRGRAFNGPPDRSQNYNGPDNFDDRAPRLDLERNNGFSANDDNRYNDRSSNFDGRAPRRDQERNNGFSANDDNRYNDRPSNLDGRAPRRDQERNNGFSANDDTRYNDRWGSQAEMQGGSGNGGDGRSDPKNHRAESHYGGGNNRSRDNNSSRYRGDHDLDGRHANERLGSGAPQGRNQEFGGFEEDQSRMPPTQNRVEDRNSVVSQWEGGAGFTEHDHRSMPNSNVHHHSDYQQNRRDDDRKRPFKEEPDLPNGEHRPQESEIAERRSSTGSRGYALDPPPAQRRRQS